MCMYVHIPKNTINNFTLVYVELHIQQRENTQVSNTHTNLKEYLIERLSINSKSQYRFYLSLM